MLQFILYANGISYYQTNSYAKVIYDLIGLQSFDCSITNYARDLRTDNVIWPYLALMWTENALEWTLS